MVLHSRPGHHALRLDFGRVLLILLALGSLALVAGVQTIPSARAQGTNPELFISPATHAIALPGTYLNYSVMIANMPTMASYNIYVKSNVAVLAPEKIYPGTFLPSGFEAINCVNATGTACDSFDGPGIAHHNFASFGSAAGSGTLFIIAYKAIGGTGTTVRFPEAATQSDSGGRNYLLDTSGFNFTGVPEVNAVYGTVAATSSSVSCLPSSVAAGSPTTCMITVTDTSVTPSAPTGIANFTSSGSGSFIGSPCTLTGSSSPTSCQATYTPSNVGTGSRTINATYGGDVSHTGSTQITTLTVTKATPTITTSLSSSTIAQGQSVTDLATLSGESPTAGGTVTYQFFSGSTCTPPPTPVGSPVTVTNGVVPRSAPQTFNTAGPYSWSATYSGDANNNGASSPCEPLTVASDSISTTLSSSTLVVGGSVFDTATLVGGISSPGGTVDYRLFSTVDCSGTFLIVSTVTVTNGVIPNSVARTFSAIAPASWRAAYSGDANNLAVTSGCELLTIVKASPTVSTSLVSTIINVGSSTIDTAALTNGFQASGTVTYSFFTGLSCSGTATHVGNPVVLANGLVRNSTAQAFSAAGYYGWNAVYSGDSNNNVATSPCELLVVIIPGANFGATLSSNSFNVGDKVVINISVVNTSPISESFTVEVKWGALTVAHQDNVPFSPGQSQSLSLTWDTSQYAAGTSNMTIAVPQTGTIQNVGPLTLNSGTQSFLAGSLPLVVGVGVAVVAVVAAAILLLRRRKTGTASATL